MMSYFGGKIYYQILLESGTSEVHNNFDIGEVMWVVVFFISGKHELIFFLNFFLCIK